MRYRLSERLRCRSGSETENVLVKRRTTLIKKGERLRPSYLERCCFLNRMNTPSERKSRSRFFGVRRLQLQISRTTRSETLFLFRSIICSDPDETRSSFRLQRRLPQTVYSELQITRITVMFASARKPLRCSSALRSSLAYPFSPISHKCGKMT